jgi:hypothetical protein
MLPWQLAQEYPDNPEEAFIRSGNPVFDVDHLRTLLPRDGTRGSLSIVAHGLRAPEFVAASNGAVEVFRFPEIADGYVIGADVAEGLEHGDFSSAHVVSMKRGDVVATWHGHIDPDLFGEELAKLGWFYNRAFVACEANNHGLTTNKALQRLDYPRLYVRRELDGRGRSRKQGTKLGWLTTKTSKPLMIDELARDLRLNLGLECRATIGELLTYTRDERGAMSGSPFDDRVISLAIANQMRPYARTEEYAQPEDSYFTWDYFFKKVTAPLHGPLMGAHHRRDKVPL